MSYTKRDLTTTFLVSVKCKYCRNNTFISHISRYDSGQTSTKTSFCYEDCRRVGLIHKIIIIMSYLLSTEVLFVHAGH